MILRRLFINEDNRPALLWRVLCYAILYVSCLILRGPLQEFLARSLVLPIPVRIVVVESIGVAMAIGATIGVTYFVRRFVDRRPWSGMALPDPRRRPRDLLLGLGLGSVMILAVFAIEAALGWFRISGIRSGVGPAMACAVLLTRFIHFVGTSVCEETSTRGYLFQNIGEGAPVWVAALSTGLIFGLSHAPSVGLDWGFFAGGIVGSVLLAQFRLVTGSIWFGVGWHLGWDWFQDSLGLSPGNTLLRVERLGPPLWTGRGVAIEGGLLIVAILALAVIGTTAWARAVGRPLDWLAKLAEDGSIEAEDRVLAHQEST